MKLPVLVGQAIFVASAFALILVPPARAGRAQTRALVLGGGGLTGGAWEVGVLKGLADAGVTVEPNADLVIGTSIGASLGARLRAGAAIDELYARTQEPVRLETLPSEDEIDSDYLRQTSALWERAPATSEALRREVGERALAASPMIPEEAWVDAVTRRLGVLSDWPERPLEIAAVDVEDGSLRLIDRSQGVSLARAVAASQAIPAAMAPVTIGDRRYMDGSVQGTNVDAAAGYDTVLAIVPFAPWLGAEVDAVQAEGGTVVALTADRPALRILLPDLFDPDRVGSAAEAGYRQGQAAAADVIAAWR